MKILCLRPYCHGYSGFLENETDYLYFSFTPKGGLKELMTFPKSDYEDHGHFVGGITKFFPYNFFLKEPLSIESCTIEELDRISRHISDAREGDNDV
jgi:hypothetical protein